MKSVEAASTAIFDPISTQQAQTQSTFPRPRHIQDVNCQTPTEKRGHTPDESLHSFRFSPTTPYAVDISELRQTILCRRGLLKHCSIQHRGNCSSTGRPDPLQTADSLPNSSRRRQHSSPETRIVLDLASISVAHTPEEEPLAATNTSDHSSRSSVSSHSTSSSLTSSCSSSAEEEVRPMPKPRRVLTEGILSSAATPRSSGTPATHQRRRSLINMMSSALHHPTRFLPQNQAIITTHEDWRISVSNNEAASILVGTQGGAKDLVGKLILNFIDPASRTQFVSDVVRRRESLTTANYRSGGAVLVCGEVLSIMKQDGTISAASLWLKEKRTSSGSSVYIWIFEEVFQSLAYVQVDSQGIMHHVDEGVRKLYGYDPSALTGKSLAKLIPFLATSKPTIDLEDLNRLKFFGSTSQLGANFPVIARLNTSTNFSTVRITSIPTLAGLVTVRKDGSIEGCNVVFAKYMFGYSQEDLVVGKKRIGDLIPQYPTLLSILEQDDLLHHGYIISHPICRQLLADTQTNTNTRRRLSKTPHGQTLPAITATHRDGTSFEVELQIKRLEGTEDRCALWITFDREATFSRFGHALGRQPTKEVPQQQQQQVQQQQQQVQQVQQLQLLQQRPRHQSGDLRERNMPSLSHLLRKPMPETVEPQAPAIPQPSPLPMGSIKSFSRPSFVTVTSTPSPPIAITPPSFTRANVVVTPKGTTHMHMAGSIQYSAQTKEQSIDDYEILEELGQGAYGIVKLAVRINDPEQKKVVIKYVIKSRILVDCWTRDRKLGLVPIEIHVMHTLGRIPHENCSDMLDYFEDDDNYYIVMGLHGAGMDLFDYIELKNGMTEEEIRDIFRQVASAVHHLHSHKIIHRDIKDENVILDQHGGVRLIDFGSAAYLREGRRYETFVGTLDYAAPEILRGQNYEGPPQDIWALGILLYTLMYRENPFYDIDEIMAQELRVPFTFSQGKPIAWLQLFTNRYL
ncbi:hypothetical protein CLU79DRAFT_774464 [Phycomyces nitens]|nr:hypothetical protein CLU79DRAFT_774464 [Phycomyces nitens]